MRNRLNSMRTASRRRTASEVIDALEEDLKQELNAADLDKDTIPIEEGCDCTAGEDCEDCEASDLIAEANEFLASVDGEAELPDAKACVSEEDEIVKACDEVEKQIACAEAKEKEEAEAKEASEILASCDEVERRIVAAERRASTVRKGIEDRIGDQTHGGQPSTRELAKSKPAVGTRNGVFGTNSRSQYVASITKRLDRVADILEKQGKKRMAFRIDRLADAIEKQANI